MSKITALLTAVLVLISVLSTLAQSPNGKIGGSVGDENGRPIEAATISLLNAKDSTKSKMTVTDKTGHFAFENLADGKYRVLASTVGHNPSYSSLVELSVDHA